MNLNMKWLEKVKPQIALVLIGIASIAVISMAWLDSAEIASVCVGGMIAIGTRLIEKGSE